MPLHPIDTKLYHITDVNNLPAILSSGGLRSDVAMAGVIHEKIGYAHIKERRMTQYRVPCCGNRFVGEFVPFYYCPRSPMLFTINKGNTAKPAGCQTDIIHLVSNVGRAIEVGPTWAISDGNAGAGYTSFDNKLAALANLEWDIIHSNNWAGEVRRNKKSAEFLVADFFPWQGIDTVACHNSQIADRVSKLLTGQVQAPNVVVRTDWYY
ncbi:DUF4433 domain-containing protein [Polaromonas sp. P1(28)-8]|nr:DUF4433 domain-containing protein [Polaromonas sp. P1(28)-8]